MQAAQVSEKQKEFAVHLAMGMSVREAGAKSGFTNPTRDALAVFAEPAARRYVKRNVQALLITQAAPQAYKLLYDTMLNEEVKLPLRVQIAFKLFEAAGHVAPKAAESDSKASASDNPRDMTADQLRAFIARAESEIAERSRPAVLDHVAHTPNASAAQGIESLI